MRQTLLKSSWSWAAGLALFALLAAGLPASAQCTTFSGLIYGTYVDGGGQTQNLLLDLMVPASASPLPLVIWIHGGGWTSGSRTPIPDGPAGMCSRGYAVASLDYRFSPTWIWPTQLQDVKGAVRWLRSHAATYNLDPDRFGAWGASAGGHLAAMLGTAGDVGTTTLGNLTIDLQGTVGGNAGVSSRVQAVADWYGATDFLQMRFYPATVNHDAATSDESHLIGGALQLFPEQVASADPITFVTPDDPPFVIMHGTVDDLIPFNQSELLTDALRTLRVPVTFSPVQNIGHGGSGWETSANYQVVYDVFDAALKNLGAPTVSVTAAANAGEAGPAVGHFTITRTGSTAAPLTVQWALAGTATPGTDYAAPLTSGTIPAGASSLDVTVTPVDDLLVEGNETVELRLAWDAGYRIAADRAMARLTIADNDSAAGLPVVTLQAANPNADEAGPSPGAFTVTVAGGFSGDLAVRYTVAGTAQNGADYAPLSGVVTIPAGQTSATIAIDPLADGVLETAETVFVTLAPSTSYAVGAPATAGVVIADADRDPAKPPIVSVSATDPDAAEPGGNSGAFTVSRTGSTSGSLPIELKLGGAAQNGGDYGFIQRYVTFAPGASRMLVNVSPLDDPDIEGPEDVTLGVVAGSGYELGPYAGSRVIIQDNEPSPGVNGLYTLPPCRLADTRWPAGPAGAPSLAAGEIRVFPVSGLCGVPPDAIAVSVNITSVNPASTGNLTFFQPGAPRPNTWALSTAAGLNRANNAILPVLGRPLALAVWSGLPNGVVDVVIDVNGYFK